MTTERTYIAIDLKSFYASVECVKMGLDPLTTNLVVADKSRTDKTICLAVSPSLKAYGIPGRARLFEVIQRLREVNAERQYHAPNLRFSGKSTNDTELRSHPELAIDFIAATPRMAFYMEYSTRIYNIYSHYVSPDDIHVYSIDEVFIDATNYLKTYHLSAHDMAMKLVQEVLTNTGITATAGIGTNMFLAKVAMDIVAKHIPADKDGVRIAQLDEMSFRQQLWNHRPLTDFWRVGRGIARRLEQNELYTMGMVARCSIENEELLYKLFGVNAELLIDHAWGWEPCTIADIKKYRPENNSLSSGQVLSTPYTAEKARIVTQEMCDNTALHLLEKRLVTNQVVLTVNYDSESLSDPERRRKYQGEIVIDYYGRPAPKPAHGSAMLPFHTSSSHIISDAVIAIYNRVVNPDLLVRRITIAVMNVLYEDEVKINSEKQTDPQLELFIDYEALEKQRKKADKELNKERRMQKTILDIKKKFGNNAILKGLSFQEGATAKERNSQIGGHKA